MVIHLERTTPYISYTDVIGNFVRRLVLFRGHDWKYIWLLKEQLPKRGRSNPSNCIGKSGQARPHLKGLGSHLTSVSENSNFDETQKIKFSSLTSHLIIIEEKQKHQFSIWNETLLREVNNHEISDKEISLVIVRRPFLLTIHSYKYLTVLSFTTINMKSV